MEPSSKKLSPTKSKARVLVLASGAGSTFEALVNFSRTPSSAYEVVGVVSSDSNAGVLNRAKALGVPGFFIAGSGNDKFDFFRRVVVLCEQSRVDFIALAGFLLLVRDPLLEKFSGKILNTHPSLLPLFGGKGMYGNRVHQAVIKAGQRESGVTIHLIDEQYDQGKILAVKKVPVLATDDFSSLAERVKAEEKTLYPEVLSQFVKSHGFSGEYV